MTLNKLLTGTLVVQLIILGTLVIAPAETRPQPAEAQQQSDKYDGDCTGNETQGRCADKCPPGSYLIGVDDKTGAAICKLEPTGCPYGDSIPMDMCDKFKPSPTEQPKPAQPTEAAQCGGK